MVEQKRILSDVIDMHIHAGPDLYPRRLDDVEVVKRAKSAGLRGILLKSHHQLTVDRARLLMKIEEGIEVYGSLTLNVPATGGLNPQAVDTAIKLGAKEIWMPTISSAHHLEHEGYPGKGITIISSKGEVLPEVIEILSLIAEADVIVGTGHLSVEESSMLVDSASDLGVKKILVTHPEWELINMPVKIRKELANKGAIMEHCYYATTELGGQLDPKQIAEQIKALGADHCIIATDFGQKTNPYPVEGMIDYIKKMLKYGLSQQEIDKMTKENPARLLNLQI